MRERFTKKKPGDTLSANRINELGVVTERFGSLSTGGRPLSHHGRSLISFASSQPSDK